MKKTTLLIPLSIAIAVTAFAQDPGKKPEPAPAKPVAPQEKPKAERPKDDAMTAKDAAIVEIDKFIATKVSAAKPDNWRTTLSLPPKLTFSKEAQYEWHLRTNKGNVTVRLMPDVAPMHASNAIYLSRLGFYDTLKFHRVIPGFMAQGGDPLGNGRGGPGYKFDGEFDPKVSHDKPGRLSTANSGPGTDGSQFFLTFVPTQYLDGKHTIFGEVIDGMDVVKALENCGNKDKSGATTEPVFIEMSWIVVAPPPAPPKPATPPEAPKKP